MLALLVFFPCLAQVAHAQVQGYGEQYDQWWPSPPSPHPELWRALIAHVDIIVDGKALRWQDGNCSDEAANAKCITRIYTVPSNAQSVKVDCKYRYQMARGYLDKEQFKIIPTHAPYIPHWPIYIKDETSNGIIASLWSTQPIGHVYSHYKIIYDSKGNVEKRLIEYANPDQRTCDSINYSECFWDVDPREFQSAAANWSPAYGKHVLSCSLATPKTTGWYPSPLSVNRIEVRVLQPPSRPAKLSMLKAGRPLYHGVPGTKNETKRVETPAARMHITALRTAHLVMQKPILSIQAVRASLTSSCDPARLAQVKVTVVNKGGPLVRQASDLAFIKARDSGNGALVSASVGLPNLGHGQSWTTTLVLGTHVPLGSLLGEHQLTIFTGPEHAMPNKLRFVPSAPAHAQLNVPAGHCQIMRRAMLPMKRGRIN